LLYVPASSDKFIARAHERGADAIILDLEDGVALGEKDKARAVLKDAVPAVGRNGAKVFVRINSEPERLWPDAEAACQAGAYGLYVPKARDPKTFADLSAQLWRIEVTMRREETKFVALIEDPGAVLDAREIARAPQVIALSAGSEDLAFEMGAEPTPEVLRFPKLLIHYAAKAEGLMSFGLLRSIADYTDLEGIAAAAREAKTFGFDGASCVHPSAVALLNMAFSPSAKDVDWANRVLAAGEKAQAQGLGAFAFEGQMIDAPVLSRARSILHKAKREASGA
jgi:citrate lyase subunit beta/citryl-CoA lyase